MRCMYLDGEILVSVFFIYIGNGCLRWCQLVLLRGAKFASLSLFDTKKSSSVAKWLTKCQSNTRQMRAGGGGAGRPPNAHQMCTKFAPNAGREEGPMPWLSNWLQMAFKCSPNVKSQPNALTQAQCLEQIWWAFGDLMRVWFLFG